MIKICKNCKNRGKESSDGNGFFCEFYEQTTLYYYEDMIVDCEGWDKL